MSPFRSLILGLVLGVVVALSGGILPPSWANSPVENEIIAQRVLETLRLEPEEAAWLAAHPVLRVGIDKDFPPFSRMSEKGDYRGIVPDYLDVLSRVLKVRFEPVANLSWPEILDGARNRSLDLVATATVREERRAYLDFTDFFLPTPLVIMAREKDRRSFPNGASLEGHRVAVVRDYASGKRLLDEYPGVLPVVVETPLDGLTAVATGRAQAYMGVLSVNAHLVKENGLDNLVVSGAYDLKPEGQRFAAREDWPELRAILDKALAEVSDADQRRILDRWSPAIAIPKTGAPTMPPLTAEEKVYLAQRGPVTMCVDPDWLPYEKIDETGQHVGIAADYMEMFARSVNLDIELVPTASWAESEELARVRRCDILSFLNQSESRSEFLNFTAPYVETPVVLVARDSVTYLEGLKSLSGKTFGMVKDYVYEDYILEHYPEIDLVYFKTMDDVLKKISSGEIYATIGSLYIVTSQIQKLGLSNLKIAGQTELTNRFRVGVRNDDPVLLGLFRKAVLYRDTQRENEILQKWVSVRLEHGVDYTVLWQAGLLVGGIFILLLYRHLIVGRYNRKLKEKNRELEEISRTDRLTRLYNRLKMDEIFEIEMERVERYGHGLSIILIDIDRFKSINDRFGHQEGDRVLKAVARSLSDCLRRSDSLGRWGGEEFLVICPEQSAETTRGVAEKLRLTLEDRLLDGVGLVTASLGVAEYREGDRTRDLIKRADEALYRAKEAGRNKVEVA